MPSSTRSSDSSSEFVLDPPDPERLANLSGPFDAHLRLIELRVGVEIANRGNIFRISGSPADIVRGERLLRILWDDAADETLSAPAIHLRLAEAEAGALPVGDIEPQDVAIKVKRGMVRGRGANQMKYLHAIATHDINFGIGPAGTGKTYLAVAWRSSAAAKRVQRIVLARPAVEAGEKLGFLPGDLVAEGQSVPAAAVRRPVRHDRHREGRASCSSANVIEIAPLAYMRGRTLNDAFIILDEAQNTTIEQMKMFLTRIGFGSKAVVTGDMTQIDLPQAPASPG